MHNNSLSLFFCFFKCLLFLLPHPPHLELSRGVAVINDEQRGLASETRLAAPHPQLAISLASINIWFYCVCGSNSGRGAGARCASALTREHTWMRSGGALIAAPVYAFNHQAEPKEAGSNCRGKVLGGDGNRHALTWAQRDYHDYHYCL